MDTPQPAPFGPRRMAERVVRPRRRLRAGLAQLVCAGAGLALGLLLPRITGGWRTDANRATEVLVSVGIAIVGIASVIFSLLFLVVQWASGNFSPRLGLFRTDPLVWRTFAYIMGLLVFTTTATLAIGSDTTVSVAVPAATVIMTVVALALVRYLLLRAFKSIQLAHVLATTTERAHKVIEAFYTDEHPDRQPDHRSGAAASAPPLPPLSATVGWPGTTTVIEQIDILAMMAAATKGDTVVVMRVPIGATIQHGTAVADIHGGSMPARDVVGAIVPGPERTFHQDPAFAFRLLADIGLRALSPAVNDPATAVQVLNAVEGLLARLAATSLEARYLTDDKDRVRVVLHMPTWADFLHVGLDDLLAFSTHSPMVLLQARKTLLALLDAVADPRRREPLTSRLDVVEHELAERYALYWQETAVEGTAV